MWAEERDEARRHDIERMVSGILSGRGRGWAPDAYARAIERAESSLGSLDERGQRYLAQLVVEVGWRLTDRRDTDALAERSVERFEQEWPKLLERVRRRNETSDVSATPLPRPRSRLRAEIARLIEVAERIEREVAAANAARDRAMEAAALAAARERRWKRATMAVTVTLGIPGALAALHALGVY